MPKEYVKGSVEIYYLNEDGTKEIRQAFQGLKDNTSETALQTFSQAVGSLLNSPVTSTETVERNKYTF